MKAFRNLSLAASVLLIVGCAPGTKKKSSEDYNKGVYQRTSADGVNFNCNKMEQLNKQSWKTLVNMGSTCLANKKYNSTEMIARELQVRDVTNPWGLFFLSEVSLQKGNLEKAGWYVSKGLSFSNDAGLLIYQQGRIEWQKGNKTDAIRLVREAVEEMPSLVEGHRFLAKVYHSDLNFEHAAKHYSKVVRMRPNDQEAWQGLEICRKNGVDVSDTQRNVASREGGSR